MFTALHKKLPEDAFMALQSYTNCLTSVYIFWAIVHFLWTSTGADLLKSVIFPEIFIYLFTNSDPNLAKKQTLSLKVTPNLTLTPNLSQLLTSK